MSSGMLPNTTRRHGWSYPGVANTVDGMSQHGAHHRLAYDDASTPHEMYCDCQAAGPNLHLPAPRVPEPLVTTDAEFPEFLHRPFGPIQVSDATARMAGSLHLHFD
jgi:hypothetical protein